MHFYKFFLQLLIRFISLWSCLLLFYKLH